MSEYAWIVVAVALGSLLALLVVIFCMDKLSFKIPFMCEWCGHTYTDDEDPSDRCPICNSY